MGAVSDMSGAAVDHMGQEVRQARAFRGIGGGAAPVPQLDVDDGIARIRIHQHGQAVVQALDPGGQRRRPGRLG